MVGEGLSLNFRSTALSGLAAAAAVDAELVGDEANTGAAGISGTSPQIDARTKWRNHWCDMGKS
jgi:hypothetical protein